jgi:hypothetical protein
MPSPVTPVRSALLVRLFGGLDLVSALVVAGGVFLGLPARWWVVDVPAAVLACAFAAAGAGLLARARWAERAARVAAVLALVLGLTLVATLALTASYLSGIYGPVGLGGAVILGLVAALALPYLVAFPAAQLLWLGRRTEDAAPVAPSEPGARNESAA